MSTRCSVLYGKLGHVFRSQGDGVYYWEPPNKWGWAMAWRRLPFQFVFRQIERRNGRRLDRLQREIGCKGARVKD